MLDDSGLEYLCHTAERFFAVSTVLNNMVENQVDKPSTRLLKHIIKCYYRLSENRKACMKNWTAAKKRTASSSTSSVAQSNIRQVRRADALQNDTPAAQSTTAGNDAAAEHVGPCISGIQLNKRSSATMSASILYCDNDGRPFLQYPKPRLDPY